MRSLFREICKSYFMARQKRVFESQSDLTKALFRAVLEGNAHNAEIFLQRGGDPNFRLENGLSLLHLASCKGYVDIVRLLLKHNAKANTLGVIYDVTPLIYAAMSGHLEIVKTLVASKARINSKTCPYSPAAYWATRNGHIEVVKFLYEEGAKMERVIEVAESRKHWDIVEYLQAQGFPRSRNDLLSPAAPPELLSPISSNPKDNSAEL